MVGNELSALLSDILSSNGYSATEQPLSQTGQDTFATNLILHFSANKTEDENELPKKDVIFCLTQEDFYQNKDATLDFIKYVGDIKKDWDAFVLFSALDETEFEGGSSIGGTKIFAESLDNEQKCVAVIIDLDEKKQNAIYTASEKKTSPLYLTKKMTDAFFEAKTPFSFEDKFSAIYRLGIVKGRKKLRDFFANEIPAIEVNLSGGGNFQVLKNFSDNYDIEENAEWDTHYLYLGRANIFKAFFISERFIIIACLSVGILTILFLCLFSFTGQSGERQKYEFIKSSYMIPITIGISFVSLILGQNVVTQILKITPLNPVFQFGIKIIFSMIFISILFAAQEILRYSVTAFVYGYIIYVVSIFNIFLFSTRDLTLFVLFALEYIIIHISRSVKKLPLLVLAFILMTLPFLPYAYIIIKSADEAALASSVMISPLGNLLLSFGIFPFQIMWLKILMFMNIYAGGKGYSMKRIIFNDIISTSIILGFCFSIIFSASHFIYRPEYRKSQKKETKILVEEKNTLTARLSKDSFSGMDTHHIKISSGENALRYEVFLFGIDTEHPIYDSIYDYTAKEDKNGRNFYSFVIPDYPPSEITIDYAVEMGTRARIEVTAYYKTENPDEFRIEKRELLVE